MGGLTHFDAGGNAIMVDVSGKEITSRMAAAKGTIRVGPETLRAIRGGTAAKGDVLGVARLAGIMAAKRTAEIIPLCHPLDFDTCGIDFQVPDEAPAEAGGLPFYCIEATCTVKLSAKTGAEMEALTGVAAALLTVYDMCKAMDRAMIIGDIRLMEKSGGKSGHFVRPAGTQGAGDA